MAFSPPKGFEHIPPDHSTPCLYSHRLLSERARIEIRYSFLPFGGAHRAEFTERNYQDLLRSISGGMPVSPSPFPREGVRSEFGAHSGFTATVPHPQGINGYDFAAIVYLRHEEFGAALIWFLADQVDHLLSLLNLELYSLRFQGEPT
jgi:hypothetical protein